MAVASAGAVTHNPPSTNTVNKATSLVTPGSSLRLRQYAPVTSNATQVAMIPNSKPPPTCIAPYPSNAVIANVRKPAQARLSPRPLCRSRSRPMSMPIPSAAAAPVMPPRVSFIGLSIRPGRGDLHSVDASVRQTVHAQVDHDQPLPVWPRQPNVGRPRADTRRFDKDQAAHPHHCHYGLQVNAPANPRGHFRPASV